MKTVFYVGNFSAPKFNAAGKRVYGNSKILYELGYKVICIGNGTDSKSEYDNITFYSIEKNVNFIKVFKNIKKIIEVEKESNECTIILYGSLSVSLLSYLLLMYSKKNKYKILSDCPDWLNNKSNNILFNIIKKIDYEFEKRIINKKVDGVILISDYLKKYYNKQRTVVIPPLNLFNENKINKRVNKKTKFIYAGIPFRLNQKNISPSQMKDRLDLIIELFSSVYKVDNNFELDIYGITEEQYLYAVSAHSEIINKNIKFYGLIENDKVVKNIEKADFTILLRDKTKETMSGFSTKIAESLSLFTPVITNDTSDINKYIKNGENGFILDISNKDLCVKKLLEILNLNEKKLVEMREYCKDNQCFYYRNYIDKMKKIIEDV